jgi:hypothetical protein
VIGPKRLLGYTSFVNPTAFKLTSRNRVLFLVLLIVSVLLGALEGVYGRVHYSADAINYLNIVRAIHLGEWKLAFNSYWGFGYPLLLALVTPLFPSTPSGEWIAIHVLNVLIFATTYLSFNLLVFTAARVAGLGPVLADAGRQTLLIVGAFAIFLSIELTMDNVSRVGPDMLVSCILFLAVAQLLRLKEQPSAKRALGLGELLGAGFIVKAILLPMSIVFACVALVMLWKQRPRFRWVALTLAATAVFAIPYIAAMSRAAGHFTYGDSGPLNYAWNVNKLEPGGLWQGEPPQFGKPLHPATMVSVAPHVYIFDGPFAVTFGPFFNPPYYYQGYRKLFSAKAQIRALGGNIFRLCKVLRFQCVLYGLVICWLLTRSQTSSPRTTDRTLWPILLIAIIGTGTYLLVFLEARYIASFLAMALAVLLLAVVRQNIAETQRRILMALLLLACCTTLALNAKDPDRDVIGHWKQHQLYSNDEQWKAGLALRQMELHPGDKVAVMADLVSATRSTWAYIDQFQIVGILGGSLQETQTVDFDTYWHAPPEAQKQMLESFHHTGARAVVAIARPDGVTAPGWVAVPGTAYWVYRF